MFIIANFCISNQFFILVRLERRVKKLEAALTAILGHFDSSLAKLEVMEKAKQTREKKLDVIIDNLDGVRLTFL